MYNYFKSFFKKLDDEGDGELRIKMQWIRDPSCIGDTSMLYSNWCTLDDEAVEKIRAALIDMDERKQ